MGITDRLKKSFRQLLQRPGATVSLAPYEALISEIEDREAERREWSDAELTAAARAMLPVNRSNTADAEDEANDQPEASDASSDPDESGETVDSESAGPDVDDPSDSAHITGAAGPVAAAFAAAIKGSVTYCVDKDTGVLLLFTTKDADGKTSSSFTVTKYEEPSDSDFTPPATPGSVPSYTIPGGG